MDSLQDLINELESMASCLDGVITETAGDEAGWDCSDVAQGIGNQDYTITSGDLIAVSEVREQLNSLLMHFSENRYKLSSE